jgi:hypothetical protein
MAANCSCRIEQQQFAMSLPGQMEASMRAYIVIGALIVLAISARIYTANTQDRTSAGLNCTVDCSDEVDNGIGVPPPLNPADDDDDDNN